MSEELFAANMALFERRFPAIATRVAGLGPLLSRIVWDGEQAVDIDLGKGRLYGAAAPDLARRQLDAYRASARRILLARVYGASMQSQVGMRMFSFMRARSTATFGRLEQHPNARVSFLVVFGLGLGLHLPDLAREFDVQAVVIVEPFAEFIRHSMQVLDWTALMEACAERKQDVYLINDGDIDRIAGRLDALFLDRRYQTIDGSYVFQHYPAWVFQEVDKRLGELARQHAIARGYVEDEVKMIRNAAANLSRANFHLLVPGRVRPLAPPAFVVGSGPSIDRSIDVVKKWREHAVVFSCGTALQVLLSHGITPDYHCELENGEQVVRVLEHVRARHSFEGIRLIASTTVDPRVADLFDQVIFFLRDAVSPTPVLGNGHKNLQGIAPTVSNTAAASALFMGFRQVYLFGVDCGSRRAEVDHSANAPYSTMETLKARSFGMSIPGNFGGTVRTHWVFDMARHMLEVLQRSFRVRLYNCSDGALIKGALPKVPQAVRLAGEPVDREAIKGSLDEMMPYFDAPGAFYADADLDALIAACDAVEAGVREMIAAMRAEDRDLPDVIARVVATVTAMDREYKVARVFGSSAINLPKIASYFILRAPGPEAREALFRDFLEEYARLLEELVATTRESVTGAVSIIREASRARS